MNCPKCNGTMETVRVETCNVDRCAACGGLWFDLREIDHLKSVRGAGSTLDTGSRAKGKEMDAIRNIRCPRDGEPLVKLAFPDQLHIHYENCSICGGAFLDAGEFKDYKHFTPGEWMKWFVPGAGRAKA